MSAQYTFRSEQEKLKKENTTLDSDREYLKRKKHELDKERAHVKRLHVDKMKQMQQLRQDKDSLQQQYHGMAKWAAALETKNKSMCRRRMLL